MSVSNLTNTKWVFKQATSISTPVVNENYSINFVSVDFEDYTQTRTCSELTIGKNDDKRWIAYDLNTVLFGATWVQEAYRIIEVTGGTDVTNSSLISWLEANATQVDVLDLTNTTWVLQSSGITPITPAKTFNLTFTSNNTNYTYLKVDYDDIYYGNSLMPVYSEAEIGGWSNDAYRTLEITGGTDVTNPDLIAWLSQNATYQEVTDEGYILYGEFRFSKVLFGNLEVDKIFLGDLKIYGSTLPQLDSPTVALDGNTLLILPVENAEAYSMYDNDEEINYQTGGEVLLSNSYEPEQTGIIVEV